MKKPTSLTMSFDNLRVGKHYRLTNYGDVSEFAVLEVLEEDFLLKDLLSLDTYYLSKLVEYGTSDDFDIEELRD
jgi:hypothetical protein